MIRFLDPAFLTQNFQVPNYEDLKIQSDLNSLENRKISINFIFCETGSTSGLKKLIKIHLSLKFDESQLSFWQNEVQMRQIEDKTNNSKASYPHDFPNK